MKTALVIGIPTYRRPERLDALLAALPSCISEVADLVDVRVVVVDNDPGSSAAGTVATHGDLVDRYVVEPVPGIAAVRNRILAEAGDARLLAFIDDDERPRPGWLRELVRVWEPTRPAAVMGRVISVFEDGAEEWVLATGVFRRRPRPTGIEIEVAATGNLLLDLDQVREAGLSFDESLGLGGGEDTLFSRRLRAAGGRILWCNESETEDFVPSERVTRQWAMRRAFNGGNATVHVNLRLARGAAERVLVRTSGLIGGVARMLGGGVRHLVGRVTSDVAVDARGARTAVKGWGMVRGSLGHQHEEYARAERAAHGLHARSHPS
ncbi:glycosyltransferase [Agromyces sp. CFH 90414]|uniref:Glycosyltransferase n=1 Tax=Agromyces agglutinans TaxID=2662258 RepID=A0A6I2F5Y8_9MICO|nr:glycosyltransferase [Agromyces agglutinans]MRG60092.1 glycosyltransferase [Agromyces agglutinans]